MNPITTLSLRCTIPFALFSSAVATFSTVKDQSLPAMRVALPPAALELQARCNGNRINLTWSTQDMNTAKCYVIERKIEGVFCVMDTIRTKNGATTPAYTYTDKFPAAGTSYYRVRMLCQRGVEKSSST